MSVNVGLPKDILWKSRTVYTGAWKTPVSGRRMVRRLNIDGDGQGDLAGHGGENRAVLVYQLDSYRHWAKEFHRDDLTPGLPDAHACAITGDTGLGHLEDRLPDPVSVPDADLIVGQPFDGQILTQKPRR
jgi:hypothetical protein